MQQNQLFGFGSYVEPETSFSSQPLAFAPASDSEGYLASTETLAGPVPSDANPVFAGLDPNSLEDFFALSSYEPTPNLDNSPFSSFSVSPDLDFFPLFGEAGVDAGVVNDSPPVRPLDFFDFGGLNPGDDIPLFPPSTSKPTDDYLIPQNTFNLFPDLDLPLNQLGPASASSFPPTFAAPQQQQQHVAPSPTFSTVITMQPSPAPFPAPSSRPEPRRQTSNPSTSLSSATVGKATRRSTAPTGYRKGVAADQLLGMDAPTQSRSYITPSATSKKKIPAAFENRKQPAKKRKTSPSDDAESSAAAAASIPETLEDAITAKRRQNTLAARKSRIRKANHLQGLETLVGIVSAERDVLFDFAKAAIERCPELALAWGGKLESVGGWDVEGEKGDGEKEARRLMDGSADEGEEE